MDHQTDESKLEATEEVSDARNEGAPEPPARYAPDRQPRESSITSADGNTPAQGMPNLELASTLKLARIAQIMALVSLVIGGVLLGMAAVVVAFMAYRRSSALSASDANIDALTLQALKRTAVIAIAMSILALGVNAIALAMIYPTMIEMLQTGDYATIFEGMQNGDAPSTNTGDSFWG